MATSRSKKSATPAESRDTVDALYPPRLDEIALPESARTGAGPDYSMILESICGTTDDSQPVEQYDGTLGVTTAFVGAHQKPAVQVQWNNNLGSIYTNPGNVSGVRWGSATLISPDLVLTCGHLFDQDPNGWTVPRQNGSSNAIPPSEIATNMHINVLFQVDPSGTPRTEVSFPIVQLVEFRLGGLDMAIIRVGGNPGSTYGWTAVAPSNAAVGDMLAIIGHPAGQPKRIEAGPATQISGSTIRYNDIDTLGGNSGSGILQASTGDLVGVHTNGGCNSAGTGSNSGVAIAAIIAASPTLQALPHGSSTAFGDDVATILAADTQAASDQLHTLRAMDHLGTLKALDDPATLKAADSHTIADLLGTSLGRDTGFGSDTLHAADTRFSADQPHTLWGGDPGTGFAGDVGTGFGGDPNTWVEGVVDPGSIFTNPVLGQLGQLGGFGGARPFVQAGPYTPIGGEQAASPVDAILEELENAIAAGQAALASLAAIHQALASGELG